MISRKDKCILRRIMGDMTVCDKVCLGVMSTFSLFSCDKVNLPC